MNDDLITGVEKFVPASEAELYADDNGKEGFVRAVFSVFDVKDRMGDIVRRSAFRDGEEIAMVWSHDWDEPIGRGVIRLTEREAIFEGHFFMDVDTSAQRYKTVKNMGNLQQWSWGFRILDDGFSILYDEEGRFDGIDIQKTERFEVSPVLIGANPFTRTIEVKGAAGSNVQLHGNDAVRKYFTKNDVFITANVHAGTTNASSSYSFDHEATGTNTWNTYFYRTWDRTDTGDAPRLPVYIPGLSDPAWQINYGKGIITTTVRPLDNGGPTPQHNAELMKHGDKDDSYFITEEQLKNFPSGLPSEHVELYERAYAWREYGEDGVFRLLHHRINEDGTLGKADQSQCMYIIRALNGAPLAVKSIYGIPEEDRQGIYDHVAKHLRDGGIEPEPLRDMVEVLEEREKHLENLFDALVTEGLEVRSSSDNYCGNITGEDLHLLKDLLSYYGVNLVSPTDGMTFDDQRKAALAAVSDVVERAEALAAKRAEEGRTVKWIEGYVGRLLEMAEQMKGLISEDDPESEALSDEQRRDVSDVSQETKQDDEPVESREGVQSSRRRHELDLDLRLRQLGEIIMTLETEDDD